MKDEPPLNNRYHDQPDRHKYGAAFLEPGVPSTITPMTTQVASPGSDDATARADHVHGLTGVSIASAYNSASNYSSTDIVGNGAYQASAAAGVASIVNPSNYTRLAIAHIRQGVQIFCASGPNHGYFFSEYSFTTDGSTPSSYTTIGYTQGNSNYPTNELAALVASWVEMFYVPAGATLKFNSRFQFYGSTNQIYVSEYSLFNLVSLLN